MHSASQALPLPHASISAARAQVSTKSLWTGRALTILAVLFLLFDSFGHLAKPAPVADALLRLGIPVTLSVGIGILGLACTALYAIPRTSILGAILLTGYLGGATAINLRVSDPLFETLFPVLLGVVIWAGVVLRDRALLTLLPVRR
jgi:hypothetical protein